MRPAFFFAIGIVILCARVAIAQSSIQGLGTGYYAYAVSADGRVVVGRGGGPGPSGGAYRWTASSGIQDLGSFPDGILDVAVAVSADGSVIVGSVSIEIGGLSARQAMRWQIQTGMTGLGWLPGGSATDGWGVSGDGLIIAGQTFFSDGRGYRAFRWTTDVGLTELGPSEARGISADGQTIVGDSTASGHYRACTWRGNGEPHDLGLFPGGNYTLATAASADGAVVVGVGRNQNGLERAFRWTAESGLEELGAVPGPGNLNSMAHAVSADGETIVGESGEGVVGERDGVIANRAFLWTRAGGMQDVYSRLLAAGVDMQGWTLNVATGVSADGRVIVGNGSRQGMPGDQGWVVHLTPPCPADFDHSGSVSAQDIFEFLAAWFSGDIVRGNFNADCCLSSQDIFDFLAAWFAGCA